MHVGNRCDRSEHHSAAPAECAHEQCEAGNRGGAVAVRLPEGNTLISCGNTHRVIEVDTQDKIVWEANKTNVPLMNGFAAGIQRLPNGNTAMCSFPGDLPSDPKTTRCFEVTPDFKVVWQLKTPKTPDYYWTALELLARDGRAWKNIVA